MVCLPLDGKVGLSRSSNETPFNGPPEIVPVQSICVNSVFINDWVARCAVTDAHTDWSAGREGAIVFTILGNLTGQRRVSLTVNR